MVVLRWGGVGMEKKSRDQKHFEKNGQCMKIQSIWREKKKKNQRCFLEKSEG